MITGHRRLGAAIALAATQAGCVMWDTSTVVTVRDPGAIAVRGGAGEVALPPDGAPGEAKIGEGVTWTSARTSAAYALHAAREADRSLTLRWQTQLPLRQGERLSLVSGRGELLLPGVAPSSLFSLAVETDPLRLPLCARLSRHSARNGTVQYTSSLGPASRCTSDAGPDVAVPLWLALPSVATEVLERRRPARGVAAGILVADALTLGVLGGTFLAADPDGSSALRPLGVGSLVVGGLIALLVLPTIFASESESVVYPAPR